MKQKSHFIFLSFKKHILPTFFLLFTISLVLFSRENLVATKNGILLWANSVLPALLPFFIATELLSRTNIVKNIGIFLTPFMRPLFHVPGIGGYALIMGIISGYPVGAKLVTNFRKEGLCTRAEAERLLAFTNNSGPLFILGTVGITLFGNSEIGLLLLITHILSSFFVAFLFRFWKKSDQEILSSANISYPKPKNSSIVTFSNLGEVLATSITNAIQTIVMIGGFVVLFSVILSILKQAGFFILLTNLLSPIFNTLHIDTGIITALSSGVLELTNGLNLLTSIPQKSFSILIILSAFLLGFGGISVLLQVLSIISSSDISIKPYVIGKLLQGLIASFLTYLFIHIFPIFNFDLTPIFSSNVDCANIISHYQNPFSLIILFLFFSFALFLLFQKKRLVH